MFRVLLLILIMILVAIAVSKWVIPFLYKAIKADYESITKSLDETDEDKK